MKRIPAAPLFAIAAALPCLHAPAQTFRLLPEYADAADGHRHLELPFGVPGFRTQILVDSARLAPNGAVLSGIRFRADRTLAGTPSQVPNVTIELSQTSAAPGSLATTFASNVAGPATLVFQGTVTLPAPQTGFAGPLPWNVAIAFPQPFPLLTAQGNLLIDITGNNPSGGTPAFFLDAVQPGGAATQFGDNGPGAANNLNLLSVMTGNSLVPRQISPGHTLSFVTLQMQNPPGVLALGTSAHPVPIDLGPLGAPMHFLHVDPIVLAPHLWIQSSFFGFHSNVQLPVPVVPGLIGATLYGQSATFVPLANPLGLVLSHAVEVRLGDEFEVLPLQQLDAADPAAATGALADFGAAQPEYGAVAIRFDGVFF